MGEAQIDPLVFFSVMFGSHLVEPYIGELWIASTADSVFKDGMSQEDMAGANLSKLQPNEAQKLEAELKQKVRKLRFFSVSIGFVITLFGGSGKAQVSSLFFLSLFPLLSLLTSLSLAISVTITISRPLSRPRPLFSLSLSLSL